MRGVLLVGRTLSVRDSRFQSHILFPLCHDFPQIRVFILNHENHVGKRYNEREKTGDTLAFHKRIFFTPLYPLIRISYKPISARVTPRIKRSVVIPSKNSTFLTIFYAVKGYIKMH